MVNSDVFWHYFEEIEDPRVDRTKKHKLVDILFIAAAAVISGADSFVEIEMYGQRKYKWLRQFLELPNGIPSHDTFGRIFAAIKAEQLKKCFLEWIKAIVQTSSGEVIAIDGKTVRRSFDKTNEKSAIHVVSAWANENRIVLGQEKVDEKSNEITTIPELLSALEIQNCIITIDAMGCQRSIAKAIRDKGADYVLSLKGNQGTLKEDVEQFFQHAQSYTFDGIDCDYHKTFDKDHGRLEVRECWCVSDLEWLDKKQNWAGLNTIGMVKSHRTINGKTAVEVRYYISSLEMNAKLLGSAVRQHWGIENSLHWILDIAFREDECRIRKGNAAENIGILRHIALNLLKKDKVTKAGIAARRKKAGWDNGYLLEVLSGF